MSALAAVARQWYDHASARHYSNHTIFSHKGSHIMKRLIAGFAIALSLSLSGAAIAQSAKAPAKASHPGQAAYTPKRMEWLTTTLQAQLRKDMTDGSKFLVQIVAKDSETLVLYVRYLADVNKDAMNIQLNADREVIKLTAKAYGWDKWLVVQEDIQQAK
jgi:hypothetical protein